MPIPIPLKKFLALVCALLALFWLASVAAHTLAQRAANNLSAQMRAANGIEALQLGTKLMGYKAVSVGDRLHFIQLAQNLGSLDVAGEHLAALEAQQLGRPSAFAKADLGAAALLRAKQFYLNGAYKEALGAVNRALSVQPESAEAQFFKATLLVRSSDIVQRIQAKHILEALAGDMNANTHTNTHSGTFGAQAEALLAQLGQLSSGVSSVPVYETLED